MSIFLTRQNQSIQARHLTYSNSSLPAARCTVKNAITLDRFYRVLSAQRDP